MAEFHNENCKEIFDICTRFNMNTIDKTEAQKALSACDLSNKANFKSYVQKDLDNILEDDKITVKVDAEIKEITKDEVVVEATPVIRSKAKSKSHEVVNKTEEE
jgi:glyceraldehyde-3-phosphate dehydrogenase/erythrose-4-phosphate dehydrogenase